MEQRIVTIEQLRAEIKEYGISKLAREIGCSRTHVQRIVGGQRQPGRKFLAAMCYQPLIQYLDVMKPRQST